MDKKDVMEIFDKIMEKYADEDGSVYNEKFRKMVSEFKKELKKNGCKVIDCERNNDLYVLETFCPIFNSIGYDLIPDPTNFGGQSNTLVLMPKNKR